MPKPIIPWMGGAAMFFSKDEARVEVVNDMNGDLVNLYRVIKHHLEEFIRHFKWALISREEFLWQKNTNPETLTDIQRASRFYYLQKLAFGGKVSGQNFGSSASRPAGLNLLRIEEDLSIAHLRLARTYIERLDWAECVRRYDKPETLFYLDPPYWSTSGYGVEFGLEQYALMSQLAKTIKGKMVISVNDIPEMREAFAGLQMKTLGIRYTVGGSGRSGEQQELLIWNW